MVTHGSDEDLKKRSRRYNGTVCCMKTNKH